MISDFICLEVAEQTEGRTMYICSLPDPNISHEDQMVACGYVWLLQDPASGTCSVWIGLRDNFKDLCAGETYQRNHFVRTILYLVGQDTGFELTEAKIVLSDIDGYFNGYVHEL